MSANEKSRRSWLIVPAHEAGGHGAVHPDVVVLDLEYSVPPRAKDAARETVKSLAGSIREAEVFVRVDRDTRWADAAAAIHRGVTGIVFPGPESPEEVGDLAALIDRTEKERGVDAGSTEIALMLESAEGFRNAVDIAQASPRVTALGVGRIDLTMRLGPLPQGEFRFYRFLMTRAVVAARTLGKQPLGALWRPGSRGGVADAQATARAAREGRLMGFSGCLCAEPDQVAAVNEGYGA